MSRLASILRDIKLSHSVFALPFAVIGLLVGTRGRVPDGSLLVRFALAMVLARSAAMAFNRLADQHFDASNPRTAGRALPSGRVSRRAMGTFLAACSLGFLLTAASFGPTCLVLAPFVLGVLFGYSLTKRITSLAHLFVGLALALSPPAAYLAARGRVEGDVVSVLWLSLAVLLWVAGFDVLYACQDIEHDRRLGLHALPARLGLRPALRWSRRLHAGMAAALAAGALAAGLGALGWLGVVLVCALLVFEHGLLAGGDLSRVNAAFFATNGVVALTFSAFVCSDLLLRAPVLWP